MSDQSEAAAATSPGSPAAGWPTESDLEAATVDRTVALGWRQGSVVPRALAAYLVAEHAPRRVVAEPDDVLVVISHDCDISRADEESEPIAELLLLHPISEDQRDGNFADMRSPRRLHFDAEFDGRSVSFEARSSERWEVPRGLLALSGPGPELVTKRPNLLAQWVSRRYHRTALPDAFNERIAPVMGLIKDALRRVETHVTGMWLVIEMDELPDDVPYEVQVWVTLTDECWNNPQTRVTVQKAIDSIEMALNRCSNVNADALLYSEHDVTLHDLYHLQRWDEFEPLSLKKTPASPQAPWPQE